MQGEISREQEYKYASLVEENQFSVNDIVQLQPIAVFVTSTVRHHFSSTAREAVGEDKHLGKFQTATIRVPV